MYAQEGKELPKKHMQPEEGSTWSSASHGRGWMTIKHTNHARMAHSRNAVAEPGLIISLSFSLFHALLRSFWCVAVRVGILREEERGTRRTMSRKSKLPSTS
jgi:hypothetical protein